MKKTYLSFILSVLFVESPLVYMWDLCTQGRDSLLPNQGAGDSELPLKPKALASPVHFRPLISISNLGEILNFMATQEMGPGY